MLTRLIKGLCTPAPVPAPSPTHQARMAVLRAWVETMDSTDAKCVLENWKKERGCHALMHMLHLHSIGEPAPGTEVHWRTYTAALLDMLEKQLNAKQN